MTMGTRGLYGFYRDGETKATYNHFDSYPECLGKSIVAFIQHTSVEEMNKIFDHIVLIDENSQPTKEQIKACLSYYDGRVSEQSTEDWYCLLRKAQGDLNVYKQGLKYMIDSQDFIKESLFCEWAYIINLDNNTLEVYEGFQDKPSESRYARDIPRNGYYSCRLIATIDFENLEEFDKLVS